eukprot:c2442_g1_i1.p1 GENE.c2442_g1_i1~~c2442_g1_i1.p1  ORF type:complete len:229 (+),score=48.08 c2442_g1_i1:35-688(+)
MSLNIERLQGGLARIHQTKNNFLIEDYISVCEEITNLVCSLGRAFAFASGSLQDYMTTVRAREAEYLASKQLGEAHRTSLQELLADEVERGIPQLNEGKSPAHGRVAACRGVLRLMWFWDFVNELFLNILVQPPMKFDAAASKAYEATLSPRHAWVVRTTVYMAMSFVPTREAFFSSLDLPDNDETGTKISAMQQKMLEIQQQLWSLFRENKMEDLK